MTAYARPETLADALAILSQGTRVVLAGGTDLYPGAGAELAGDILDLGGIPGLRQIEPTPDGLRIGACVTWAQIATAPLPPALAALRQAAVEVGGRQIQTVGTLGGNLCNASPAADGVPPLLVVGAEVELTGPNGTRRLPLEAFLLGPRRTARAADEVLVALHIPTAGLLGRSRFLKFGARAYLVISIAMVAVRLVSENGRITEAALAVGACSGTARRLAAMEEALIGLPAAQAAQAIDPAAVAAALSPLDDLRASAAYRAEAATELLRRAVAEVTA